MGGEPGGGARSPARAAGRGFPVANSEAALASRPSPSANENLLQCCGGRRRGRGGRVAGGRAAAGAERAGTEAERLAGHGTARPRGATPQQGLCRARCEAGGRRARGRPGKCARERVRVAGECARPLRCGPCPRVCVRLSVPADGALMRARGLCARVWLCPRSLYVSACAHLRKVHLHSVWDQCARACVWSVGEYAWSARARCVCSLSRGCVV